MTSPRGRQPFRWRFVLALSAALILHVGLLLVAREALRWRPSLDGPVGTAMQLRLIDVEVRPAKAVRADPPPPVTAISVPSAEPQSLRSTKKTVSPEVEISTAAIEPGASAAPLARTLQPTTQDSSTSNRQQQPRLVALDGRVYIPEVDSAIAAATARFPVKPSGPAAGASNPFSHRSPVPYVATRFEPLWVPDGENLLGTFLRKLSDKVVKKGSKQIGGVQIDCVWMVVMATCTWGAPARMSIDDLKALRADVPMPRGPNTQPGS